MVFEYKARKSDEGSGHDPVPGHYTGTMKTAVKPPPGFSTHVVLHIRYFVNDDRFPVLYDTYDFEIVLGMSSDIQ